jgi:hypothetical protein
MQKSHSIVSLRGFASRRVVRTLFAPELDAVVVLSAMERTLSGKLLFFDGADEFGLVYRPAGGVMVDV